MKEVEGMGRRKKKKKEKHRRKEDKECQLEALYDFNEMDWEANLEGASKLLFDTDLSGGESEQSDSSSEQSDELDEQKDAGDKEEQEEV
jgi:hypothetical protein